MLDLKIKFVFLRSLKTIKIKVRKDIRRIKNESHKA